ncbi:hypothetical protein EDB19DRAFT_1713412 [Suillus lakei]|nr:hypothetical protein EDB19DRAFT_1713412 [Suillus lakei]
MRCILVLCFLFGMIIGLFVHTTCPSSEVFRCLPRIFGGHHCALSGWGGSGEDCGGYVSFLLCFSVCWGVLICIYARTPF